MSVLLCSFGYTQVIIESLWIIEPQEMKKKVQFVGNVSLVEFHGTDDNQQQCD